MKHRFFVRALVVVPAIGILGALAWHLWPAPASETPTSAAADLRSADIATEATAPPTAPHTETLEIRRRDTVVAALLRKDVPVATAHEITGALKAAGANLRQVRPGDQLELARDETGRVVTIAFAPSPWERFEASDSGSGWQVDRTEIAPEVRIEVRHGEVKRSLWDAVESGAVTAQVLLDLVQIFESDFDFTADTRPGDRFRLLVETRYAGGVPVDHGRILAAQYMSGGETMTAIGHEGPDRFAYYDPEGRSLKKVFLRSPLQFTRISSGFTYRRPHPILGGVRPHLAIDYAAPAGTPVWAVADGSVVFAGRKGGNGIQVLLRHRGGYQTYYNHLSRIGAGVRDGARVTQKQVIGYVGSTGLSTGPHLDYRVSHNGKFVNPLGEKFLPGEPIAQKDRARFLEEARALMARLEQEAPFRLATSREPWSRS
ncbi:MAG TPA: M23 family metallopeptidase [Burkholderiaceae bacterium]|nr:M23 family metallopeptidase [Burkholderiaceae bacterium]